MYCSNCGKQLAEGSRFCIYCGQSLFTEKMRCCPSCGAELKEGAVYCNECGTKIPEATDTESRNSPGGFTPGDTAKKMGESSIASMEHTVVPKPGSSHQLLQEYHMWSFYKGAPTVGVAYATGSIRLYSDRIDLIKKIGNAVGNLFGVIGMAASARKVHNDPIESIYLKNIQKIGTGRYGGVYNTIYIESSDHEPVTLVPVAPGSSVPQQIVDRVSAMIM